MWTASFRFCSSPSGHCTNFVVGPVQHVTCASSAKLRGAQCRKDLPESTNKLKSLHADRHADKQQSNNSQVGRSVSAHCKVHARVLCTLEG